MTWEYKAEAIDGNFFDLATALNYKDHKALKGWEVVAVEKERGFTVVLLRKPLNAPPT